MHDHRKRSKADCLPSEWKSAGKEIHMRYLVSYKNFCGIFLSVVPTIRGTHACFTRVVTCRFNLNYVFGCAKMPKKDVYELKNVATRQVHITPLVRGVCMKLRKVALETKQT